MTTPIIIEDYNPHWPEHFESIRSRIAPALVRLVVRIEHVGSTAVPGLAAKPVIDLDVLLKSSSNLSRVIEKLATLGYEHQGTLGVPGRDAFRAPAHDLPHHLYVCSPDSEAYIRHIVFRDYLRSHPQDAEDYARLKRSLAGKYSTDRDAYTGAKTEFIEEMLRRAFREKSELSSRAHRTSC